MDMITTAPAPQSWLNQGDNDLPVWLLPHLAADRAPNGSLLVHTKVGRVPTCIRVHVGQIVMCRNDLIYAREPGEAEPSRGLTPLPFWPLAAQLARLVHETPSGKKAASPVKRYTRKGSYAALALSKRIRTNGEQGP